VAAPPGFSANSFFAAGCFATFLAGLRFAAAFTAASEGGDDGSDENDCCCCMMKFMTCFWESK